MLMFELVVAIIFLLLSIGICILSLQLPLSLAPTFWVGAGAFPFILGVLLTLLSIWWIADMAAQIRRDKKLNPQREKKSWLDDLLGDHRQKLHFVIIVVSILVYVFLLVPLCGDLSREYGFVLASFLFLCVTIKLFNEISIVKTVIISAVTVVIIYLVFHYGLSVLMPT